MFALPCLDHRYQSRSEGEISSWEHGSNWCSAISTTANALDQSTYTSSEASSDFYGILLKAVARGPPCKMSEQHFFETTTRTKVRDAIVAVESQTSAELVVAIRRQTDTYLHVDLAIGTVAAFGALLLLLFLPTEFETRWMPVEVLVAFMIGALCSRAFWSHKRWLSTNKSLRASTWSTACTLFYEKKISRTSGRNGILVLISMLERRVQVVVDIGIDPESLGPEWQQSIDNMQAAVHRLDFDSFVNHLTAIGPILGAVMPRQEDDINELPDDPDMP
ncbi:MAG: hypothetical protein FWD57_08985 [Polyangiaceae bacterium]|nr:hypothetical protein [Polyangiaceae bacterium]